jgi:cobalt-zinc-cadmium efflux system outer membrane protein
MTERFRTRAFMLAAAVVGVAVAADAQSALTWSDVRMRFEASNPTLQVDQLGVDELKAAEITAFLRPNPQCGLTLDQIGNTSSTPDMPQTNIFSAATLGGTCSYLHEREHKRELRRDSARGATVVAASTHVNLDRTLAFTLRSAFVQVLTAKAALAFARENLTFYDQVLTISQQRFQAGDIAQVDLNRLQLQRVQFESAIETADVSVRTAKIQLLALMNDSTPLDQFDVTGPFDFVEGFPALNDLRQMALDARPDLRAALEGVDAANINHRLALANGSTDPTFSLDAGFPSVSQVWQSFAPPLRQFGGVTVSIPIRVFDRNQGEKLRTQIDVTKNQRQVDATRVQIISDVDTAYTTLVSTVNLLRPYRDRYLAQSTQVRDIVTQSYQRGGAALLDFLQAQQDYRAVQVSYITLVGTYLTAAAQLNEAVGQEVIP